MIVDNVENKLFFNTARNYTLSLLGAFSDVQHYVQKEIDGEVKTQKEKVNIKFAQKEKFSYLEDIDTKMLTSGNFNFLPRMAISFDSMTKNQDRTTNKLQKFLKKYKNEDNSIAMDYSYNSVPYDFNYILNIQARGLNQAFQLVEQIMPYFRPTMALEIDEMPLFQEKIVTQIQAQDPDFDILSAQENIDVQIVNVSIPITIRGNLYSPISISAPLKTIKMFEYLWDEQERNKNELAWSYELEKNEAGDDWVVKVDEH